MTSHEPNSWAEYRKLVLKELEDLNRAFDRLQVEQAKIREEIATLKVKSGIWGIIGGVIPVAIAIAVWLLKSQVGG